MDSVATQVFDRVLELHGVDRGYACGGASRVDPRAAARACCPVAGSSTHGLPLAPRVCRRRALDLILVSRTVFMALML